MAADCNAMTAKVGDVPMVAPMVVAGSTGGDTSAPPVAKSSLLMSAHFQSVVLSSSQ